METFYKWIGEGQEHLLPQQMGLRAIIVFLIAIVLIRISGRRSFGMRSAFDNVIAILLGAILSRSVVDGVPFFSPIIAGAAIVILHRV
ncbi:MAG TPA: hypothetical protein VI731_04210, partial [Bacteroidia bacterium]|nr:hypothetical protein [Bacteroidia bacterium]